MTTRLTPPRRSDLASNAAQFRSVVIVGWLSPDDVLCPDVDAVAAFIDVLTLRTSELLVEAGNSFHLFYGRSASIAIQGILNAIGQLGVLGQRLHRSGLSIELSVSADDALANPQALLVALEIVDSLYLSIPDASMPERAEALRQLLDVLLGKGTALTLTADPAVLRALGLFAEVEFNRRYMTVIADTPQSGRMIKVPHVRKAPCSNHLRLYIDAAGDVYPCAGTVGFAPARMGRIFEPDIDRMLGATSHFDYVALAAHGPSLADAPQTPFDLCDMHRRAIIELADRAVRAVAQ